MPTSHEEQLQLRIRELEKEVARLHDQIKQQRYGLNWIDVPEAFDKESENKIPTLEEVPELSFKTDDGKPTHILIEGDNYHALTCLNYTHRGKVDVIYIDPPYNTGSDGFIYKDKRMLDRYPDGTPVPVGSPQRHSYWLSFMHRRLELAKNLLSERGVIFISIDDNEQANLKLLCDEVFGTKNFIASLIWRGGKRNMSKWISTSHEYMLLFAKNLAYCSEKEVEWHEQKQGLNDIYLAAKRIIRETRGNYEKASEMLKQWFRDLPESNPSKDHKHYCWIDDKGVYFASDISRGGGGGPQWQIQNPHTGENVKTPQRGWAYSSLEELQEDIKNGLVHFNGNGVPCKKRYLKDNETQILDTVFYKDRRGSSKRLRELMGIDAFPFPKDELILADKLKSFSLPNSIILDFFAGSGTTLHATMNLNEEDGGKRQCILVQYPEKTWEIVNGKKKAKKGSEDAFKYGFDNITEITYERNRRVMQGYTDAKGNEVERVGNSLKYYRTAFVGENDARHANEQDRLVLSQKAGCLLALAENTLDETLRTSHYQLFTDGERLTAVYFQEDLQRFEEFVEQVRSKALPTSVYVFCWGSADEFLYNFEDIPNVSLKSIPEPILKIYQTLNA